MQNSEDTLLNFKKYQSYRLMPENEKKQRIDNAIQQQKYRKKNPQRYYQFDEYQFMQFQVQDEKNKKIKLHTYRQNTKNIPIAVMIIFHGLNSHVGHGAHLAHFLSQYNILSVGYDYRGFGRSQGQPGYVQSLNTHLQDAKKFVNIIKNMYLQLPLFCLGLSMGGMTAYHLSLEQYDLFKGVILMAPALKNSVGGFLVSIAQTLGKVLPKKTKLTKPIYGRAAKNPQISQDIKKDKYAYGDRVSLSTINMLVSTMSDSPKTFDKYKSPFLIIQGGLDKMVNPQIAFELYDKSQTSINDKEILFYQDMWHDIWHEQQIDQIMQNTIKWILNRLKNKQNK